MSPAALPIKISDSGYAASPPMTAVPKTSARHVRKMFFVLLYVKPHSSAPKILPGKANILPKLSIFRISEAVKADAKPYAGPRKKAQNI